MGAKQKKKKIHQDYWFKSFKYGNTHQRIYGNTALARGCESRVTRKKETMTNQENCDDV